MTRLFVAIWPGDEAIAALTREVARVQPRHPELRWQAPERWHITVAFLGPADSERTERRLVRLLTDPPASAPIRMAGAGTFGPVLWVGVAHDPWLADLARRIQRGLRTADNRFRAHITVARGRGSDARGDATAAVPDLRDHDGPPWTPLEVTLVESETGPAPRYSVLRRWPLGVDDGSG